MSVVRTLCQIARNAEMRLLASSVLRVFTSTTTLEDVCPVATTERNANSAHKTVVFYVTLVSSSQE